MREFLFENGFEIGTEIATHEGNRFYIAFDAFYSGEVREFTVADCFLGKLPKTEDAKIHIEKQVKRLQKRYDATKEIGKEDAELFETIQKLKGFLNG